MKTKKVEILNANKNFSQEVFKKIHQEGWAIVLYSIDGIPISITARKEMVTDVEIINISLINSVNIKHIIQSMGSRPKPKTTFTNSDSLFISELITILHNKINERKH